MSLEKRVNTAQQCAYTAGMIAEKATASSDVQVRNALNQLAIKFAAEASSLLDPVKSSAEETEGTVTC